MAVPDHVFVAKAKDLGGFAVRRALPQATRRMVGPFIFLDEMGPTVFGPGLGMDVRPHPHIGLSTVTWLFDGELTHRDSTGAHQSIRPGDVNLMVAGRGVVHSERTDPSVRAAGHRLHGMQSWIASPKGAETAQAAFFHHPSASLPRISGPGFEGELILGAAFGAQSPVQTQSPLFYLNLRMEAGVVLDLPHDAWERGIYLVHGQIDAEGVMIERGSLAAWDAGQPASLLAVDTVHLMVFGGEPFAERRFIDWNYVASDPALIEAAKQAWREGPIVQWSKSPFTLPDGEETFIPLPE
jgi:redox-sensitive bicupin YhaK (pirin superfamily)